MAIARKLSIAKFKSELGVDELTVCVNPKNGKRFIATDSKVVGAVSTKWEADKMSAIIQLDEEGNNLFVLVNQDAIATL